jgi:hypothetical protein
MPAAATPAAPGDDFAPAAAAALREAAVQQPEIAVGMQGIEPAARLSGLAGRVGHRNRIGRVVDHDSIVNVVVDEVIRRRRNVPRWIDPHRHRHINRNGKNVFINRRRGGAKSMK